jgi:hypothetical protein
MASLPPEAWLAAWLVGDLLFVSRASEVSTTLAERLESFTVPDRSVACPEVAIVDRPETCEAEIERGSDPAAACRAAWAFGFDDATSDEAVTCTVVPLEATGTASVLAAVCDGS